MNFHMSLLKEAVVNLIFRKYELSQDEVTLFVLCKFINKERII